MTIITTGLGEFAKNVSNPDGLIYAVSNDTLLSGNVKTGVDNLKQSTELLNENLKAMRKAFFSKIFQRTGKEK
ncbi:MAG: hypothetical protein IPP71_02340 [Bacteroidetes bacterium]|nr:hypothetical protein [Bacteroidota bacterium]